MPLIILCGFPSSGKTTIAKELLFYFKSRIKTVLVLDLEEKEKRDLVYSSPSEEKRVSGSFLSKINKELNNETLVIADGMNYIKGFRYQLYLLVKEQKTKHCLVYITTGESESAIRNKKRQGDKYSEELFSELVFRFEEPNFSARWDKPCFPVLSAEELPFCDLGKTLLEKKIVLRKTFLDTQRIEKRIDEIVEIIMKKEFPGKVMIFKEEIYLGRKPTLFDIKKLKAHFIGLFWRQKATIEELDSGIIETIKTICTASDYFYS